MKKIPIKAARKLKCDICNIIDEYTQPAELKYKTGNKLYWNGMYIHNECGGYLDCHVFQDPTNVMEKITIKKVNPECEESGCYLIIDNDGNCYDVNESSLLPIKN